MSSSRKGIRIVFNAPATLTFVALCLIVQGVAKFSGGSKFILSFFSVSRAPLSEPLTYVRCFTHVLGHSGWSHLLNNVMYILLLGPMLEEQYGSKNIVIVILVTAAVTGLIHIFFFPRTVLLGASGVVFAFILMSSITVREDRTIPVTFILVALLYIGQQVYQGVTQKDNISQITHIAGGTVGTVLGFLMSKKTGRKDRSF